MKKKLKKTITFPTVTKRLGDFICNFAAVVLGIVITFVGSDMIQEHNKKKEVSQALQLIKSELLINRENIATMMQQEMFEQRGALYLLQYKDKMHEASVDSLNKYGFFPFQSNRYLSTTDAMDMLRSSSLMQNIKNKELAIQIIKTYTVIKGAYRTFDDYMDTKGNLIEKLTNKQEYQKNSSTAKSQIDEWNFNFKQQEGVTAIQRISYIHSNPERMYGRYLEFINKTVAAIDKEYN